MFLAFLLNKTGYFVVELGIQGNTAFTEAQD